MAVQDKILRQKGNSIFQTLGKRTINDNDKSSAKSNEYRKRGTENNELNSVSGMLVQVPNTQNFP